MENLAWESYGSYLSESNVTSFMKTTGIESASDLIKRSTEDIEWFWDAAIKHLGVEFFEPYDKVLDKRGGISDSKWFLGGKLNIVHNCLDRHASGSGAVHTALIFESDEGSVRKISYQDLNRMVNEIAWALKESGVGLGDKVALCMPISIEAVAVMLATLKVGAVSMQLSCRISPNEFSEHIKDASPKVLFMNDGYCRGGKRFDCHLLYDEIKSRFLVNNIVVLERLYTGLVSEKGCESWHSFVNSGYGRFVGTSWMDSEDHSLILYSSGTTGRSKAVIHTHAGALVQAAKEVGYFFDCHRNDTFFWFTNIGWMMAPWEIIGTLFFGATLALYEGTPFYPNPHRVFEIIERHKVNIFGFVPTAMRALASLGEDFSKHDTSSLRILGSTGEPLDGKTWEWYFRVFGKKRCPIINFSGGTELIGGLVGSLPILSQKPGTVGGPALGMDVDIVDENGTSIRGKVGYLVCRKSFPSMTKGFLNNWDGFMETYFSRMPGVWFHGDLAEIDEDGFWFLRGRADDLIVRSGVKHDPAKIEQSLINFPGEPKVLEAAAVGIPDQLVGQKIVCFVVVNNNEPEKFKEGEYSEVLKKHVGVTHDPMARPDQVHLVKELPKNMAGKIPRNVLRKAYNGEQLGDLSKLENLEVLEEIKNLKPR
ncbi:MAG: hypothetical protein A3B91_02335 [Candidatus Yanofskybacteria bacterium RIFCSPHIGHO2_02_FULL_41_29]|uniref:acetate--CoA ligase n=1 Tax=Candidatus Yanofskybacteria bacterium RIFCSPHIGHO2_01_FULL_41_53 TaxID=1802663 RepID=A0A1F8EJV2_9BACT|nr:MAG: hypothetical protein A2650_01760 [Candidatus Yanofskybacteria bacterium RIFCSPHIGHO2_01_FULL_41_53]OGN12363.1 MAG: hypothetical protein A3B91_02335 [Candidatus Yanofskybacteria bacterium RIFCSPHIGHO2_02_FULL_41_29]OGN17201.1 MAG: hypothetical protein A3F48_00175 [Candidatus Yanofskybacteria bacterium RIFCSPHIGHO2_12_FULL_41_9]OGN23229.1 MAG: hypothetical protein A2916_02750 [Candidatus Yanofskybacteria bacterium RIFCSPLOWO2_01_FULL_41_67]OGN28874.1 MAG: hypothetical protein A3H54_01890 